VSAIYAEEDVPEGQEHMTKLNAELSTIGWPSITKRKAPLPEADAWKDKTGKLAELKR
jgi:ferredoxin